MGEFITPVSAPAEIIFSFDIVKPTVPALLDLPKQIEAEPQAFQVAIKKESLYSHRLMRTYISGLHCHRR